jgi:hypothetical protein
MAKLNMCLRRPDSNNVSNLWGPSEYDVRQALVVNYLYAVPYFVGQHNLAGEALGGWEISGTARFQTGNPCGVGTNNDAGVENTVVLAAAQRASSGYRTGHRRTLGALPGRAAPAPSGFLFL